MTPGNRFYLVFQEEFGPFLSRLDCGAASARCFCYPVPDFADRIMRLKALPAIVIPLVRHIASLMYENGVTRCLFPDWNREVEAQGRYDDWSDTALAATSDFLDMLYEKARNMDSVMKERWLSACANHPLVLKVGILCREDGNASHFAFVFPDRKETVKSVETSYRNDEAAFLKAFRRLIPEAGYGHGKSMHGPFLQEDLDALRDMERRNP